MNQTMADIVQKLVQENSFQARVYLATAEIPKGQVASYADIGKKIGSKAYRAIGQALAKNPYIPLIPCHRVICSDGTLGGYALGRKEKTRLLRKEGLLIENGRVVSAQ